MFMIMLHGTRPFALYQRNTITSTEWTKVDQFDASSSSDYSKGWRYKKDTTQVLDYYRGQDWTDCPTCLGSSATNAIAGNATIVIDGDTIPKSFPIGTYGEPVIVSGSKY